MIGLYFVALLLNFLALLLNKVALCCTCVEHPNAPCRTLTLVALVLHIVAHRRMHFALCCSRGELFCSLLHLSCNLLQFVALFHIDAHPNTHWCTLKRTPMHFDVCTLHFVALVLRGKCTLLHTGAHRCTTQCTLLHSDACTLHFVALVLNIVARCCTCLALALHFVALFRIDAHPNALCCTMTHALCTLLH